MDPVILFYFVGLATAVLLAIKSGDDTLQQLAAVLFVGWGIYNPVNEIVGGAGNMVFFNSVLDLILLGVTWVTIRHTDSKAGRYICIVFGLMLVWHSIELLFSTGWWYFRVYNGLFLAQLVILSVASVERIRAAGNRQYEPPQSGNQHFEAQILQWPMNPHPSHTQPLRRDSTSALKRYSPD